MGATIAALTFDEDNLVAAHAGDVRIYRFRAGAASRLTRDHSILEELRAARAVLSPEDMAAMANRNVITRALGSKPELDPTVYLNSYADGDLYLLVLGRPVELRARRRHHRHRARGAGPRGGLPCLD